jgi:diguanylate cyclase (GGDEF)-like protein
MARAQSPKQTVRPSDETELRTISGIRAKESAPPSSGVRLTDAPVVPRLYDYDDETEVSVTTNLIEGKRGPAFPRFVVIEGTDRGNVLSLDSQRKLLVGRANDADIELHDTTVSRRHCRICPSGDAFEIEDLGSSNGTFVNGKRLEPQQRRRLRADDRIQFGERSVVQFKLFDDIEDTLARRLYDSAVRDPLTQVYNRRHFDQRLNAETSYALRHGSNLSVLMLDIDHFKSINDQYGHAAGDAVLVAVAAEIGRTIRTEDILTRYGGEEFALIVHSDTTAASLLAERIRMRIQALTVSVGGATLRVTASVGVSSRESIEAPGAALAESLVTRADRRLYRAKRLGRNTVCNSG